MKLISVRLSVKALAIHNTFYLFAIAYIAMNELEFQFDATADPCYRIHFSLNSKGFQPNLLPYRRIALRM